MPNIPTIEFARKNQRRKDWWCYCKMDKI
jgi:hypothetical protein